jgi:glyoxylase-like metal-dependent hydrolase (beta-lactamase superfamily II)
VAEARQLDTVQGEVEVAPGVRVVPVGGHTAYHQMVVVEGGGQRLVIPTDLLPTASHLPLPFIMSYDLFPVGTLEAKRRLLAQAAEGRWLLLFYHDPRTAVARVKREKERYVVGEKVA